MKISRNATILCTTLLLTGVWVGLYVEAKMEVMGIPPVPPQIQVDVITHDRDLLKVTSTWPTSLTVENISDKEVSGFTIEVFAANDDGGPMKVMGCGMMPWFGKQQTPLFKPKEVMTLPISPETVKLFTENNKPFLYVQLASVGINNDSTYMYTYGALLKQDPNNPKRYNVVVDAKGRSRNHHPVPHISHSIQPPFPLGCCTREFYSFVNVDCNAFDPCADPAGSEKCYVANKAYTVCNACCTDQQVTSLVACRLWLA